MAEEKRTNIIGKQHRERNNQRSRQISQRQSDCRQQEQYPQSSNRNVLNKKVDRPMGRQRSNRRQKQVLVFDQKERVEYVKGFGKRKQERREKAKQEAIEKGREMRRLVRQKRREALNRYHSTAVASLAARDDDVEHGDDGTNDGDGHGEEAEKD